MDDIAVVIKRSRRMEKLLREHYHAEGKGLHQLINSSQKRLPHDVIEKLRFIATIRNKTVHEDDFQIDNIQQFIKTCDECEKELQPRSNRLIWRLAVLLIVAFTGGAVWFYASYWEHIVGQ